MEAQDPRMPDVCGFRYGITGSNYTLEIGDLDVDIRQWSREEHERCLAEAGLVDIQWYSSELPVERSDLEPTIGFHLEHPSCTVLSARRPHPDAGDT